MDKHRYNMYIDRAFFQVVKELYAEPRGISMAKAMTAAMEDALTTAGLDWEKAVKKYHAGTENPGK